MGWGVEPLSHTVWERIAPQDARLPITKGGYHQVRRRFAALGNHAEALHREAIGGIAAGRGDGSGGVAGAGGEVGKV